MKVKVKFLKERQKEFHIETIKEKALAGMVATPLTPALQEAEAGRCEFEVRVSSRPARAT